MRSAPSPRSGSRGRRRVSVPRLPALAFFALLACFAASSAMGAEILSEKELKPLIKEWALSLELVTHKLESGSVSELDLELLHRELTRVRAVALEVGAAAHARLAETTALLETLGPPPAEGAPAESKEIVAERKRLHDELSRISAQAKQAELMVFRAETLLGQLGTARRAGIAQALVTRGPSLFAIDTWEIAGGELVPTLGVIVTSPVVWWESEEVESRRGVGYFALLFVVPILAMALGWLTRVWLSRRFGRDPTIPHPPYYRRLGAAITEGVAHGLVPTLTVLSPYLVFLAYGLLFGPFAEVVRAAVVAVSVFSLTTAMIGAVFAPGQPDWRLAPFDDRASRGLGMRLILLTGVVNIDLFLGLATIGRTASPELLAVYYFFVDSAIAAICVTLLPRRLWAIASQDGEGAAADAPRASRRGWAAIRLAAWIVVLTIPVAALLGYHELSRFLTLRLLITGGILGAVIMLHGLARDATALMLEAQSGIAPRIRRAFGFGDQDAPMFRFWTPLIFDVALGVVGLLVVLPYWGVEWNETFEWLRRVLTGFRIGEVTFSPAAIILASIVFLLLLAGLRVLQRQVADRLLPQTRLDTGVQQALRAAVGYIGVFISVLIAISIAGIDLSNLALIVGALSVGIGFGLQNIVNNFVSGLILLVERPIKAGDWIVVGTREGIVKRISVRATEITTFQRASVIIPNSEILQGALTNWTHKDKYGRIEIPVGVAYGSDTELVRDLLLKCASEHPNVAGWPQSSVYFKAFAADALEFELRVYMADIGAHYLIVTTDLHFAIDKAFREHGVSIAFPQRDLHLRDIDRIEAAIRGEPRHEAAPPRPHDQDEQDEQGKEPDG